MKRPKYHQQIIAGLCIAIAWCSTSFAAGDDWDKKAHRLITSVSKQLKTTAGREKAMNAFDGWLKSLAVVQGQAKKCVDDTSQELAKLQENLNTLGEPLASADVSAKRARNNLEKQVKSQEKHLATCRALLVDSEGLIDKINQTRQQILATYLLARGPTFWTVVIDNLSHPGSWYETSKAFLSNRARFATLSIQQWFLLVALFGGGLLAGRWIRDRLREPVHDEGSEDFTTNLLSSCRACAAKRSPLVLALALAALGLVFQLPMKPLPPLMALILSIGIYIIAATVVNILLKPSTPARYFLPLDPDFARALHGRLRMLLLLGLFGVLGYITGVEDIMTAVQWYAVRATFLTLVIINLLWIVASQGRLPGLLGSGWLRVLMIAVLLAALAAELTGYRNLSIYLIRGLLGTALVGLAVWLVNALLRELFDGLDDGHYQWQRRTRELLSLKKNEPVPGLVWLRLLTAAAIWLSFAMTVLRLWGYSGTSWSWLWQIVAQGFQAGNFKVVPLQWAIAIAVFAVLVALVRWLKQDVLPRLVSRTRLDRGAREALITISGYAGVITAALFGLSLAGFNFTNLAIIAGALSVGIGFGLQNIVNNFLSGIILLFERPIRTGDWIIVGDTEGYVRRISIRSTLIETFDRADVIVPNSQLIANQVINMTLRDIWGRLIVPVGVAYGSDVDKVRDILLAVANDHPLVLKEGTKVSPPSVLFREFGDSSLNFELRCFIRNIDKRLGTLSDLNFAIEKALRRANIEIPFPQRDLHLRSISSDIHFPPS